MTTRPWPWGALVMTEPCVGYTVARTGCGCCLRSHLHGLPSLPWPENLVPSWRGTESPGAGTRTAGKVAPDVARRGLSQPSCCCTNPMVKFGVPMFDACPLMGRFRPLLCACYCVPTSLRSNFISAFGEGPAVAVDSSASHGTGSSTPQRSTSGKICFRSAREVQWPRQDAAARLGRDHTFGLALYDGYGGPCYGSLDCGGSVTRMSVCLSPESCGVHFDSYPLDDVVLQIIQS